MNKPFLLFISALLGMLILASCTPPVEEENQQAERLGGAALYTVRDHMKRNPDSTLAVISEMGYAYVEEAVGYQNGLFYGQEPADFKEKLASLSLIPMSTHQGGITLQNADTIIQDVAEGGFRYLVIPVPPMGHFHYDIEARTMGMSDSLEFLAGVLNTIGEKCSKAGLEMLYHNHDFEFRPNSQSITPIRYFLEHTNPEFVNFEMDLYWVTKAGADPLTYFEEYPGRFKAWHVKDMDAEGRFAPVGTGNIDFAPIVAKKAQSGMQHYFVEQDLAFERDPLEALRISHAALAGFGFE